LDKPAGTLSEEVVRKVTRIIAALSHSTFDYLRLESAGFNLTLARDQQAVKSARRRGSRTADGAGTSGMT
jgi:hypothetical protein